MFKDNIYKIMKFEFEMIVHTCYSIEYIWK